MEKEKPCIYCKEFSNFLNTNGFCQCREGWLKQKFLKRKKISPYDNMPVFLQFARRSYQASRAIILQKHGVNYKPQPWIPKNQWRKKRKAERQEKKRKKLEAQCPHLGKLN